MGPLRSSCSPFAEVSNFGADEIRPQRKRSQDTKRQLDVDVKECRETVEAKEGGGEEPCFKRRRAHVQTEAVSTVRREYDIQTRQEFHDDPRHHGLWPNEANLMQVEMKDGLGNPFFGVVIAAESIVGV